MERHIEILAENLCHIMERELSSGDDFVSLAVNGEQLRRALLLADDEHPKAARILKQYDDTLASYDRPVPDDMGCELGRGLAALEEYAGTPRMDRDTERGEEIDMGIEEILSVAVAACRCDRFSEPELVDLAERARQRVTVLTPRLRELWQLAEDRLLAFSPDPDFPMLHAWWEELAELAISRLALERVAALMPPHWQTKTVCREPSPASRIRLTLLKSSVRSKMG